MTDRIESLNVSFVVRNMTASGPTSSDKMNDLIEELGHDLVVLQDQWDNRLLPLTISLPYGESDPTVDAFTNGLDGKNLYVDQSADSTSNPLYFNSTSNRPNTVYEQLENIYSAMTTLENSLSFSVNNLVATAANVAVVDTSNLYTATDVEAALAEVMNLVASLDLSEGASSIRRMDTTARDALTPTNSMIIYNTTTNKFEGYENGSWVTFTTS